MNLEIFKNSEFGEVRTINENGKIMFCGSDVAKILGYAKPQNAISMHCKGATLKQGIGVQTGIKKDGTPAIQHIEMTFIGESDLYRLIACSKLESAQKFESWIFDEVLPTIRKTGGYVANEDLFINTYLPYADEPTKRLFSATLEVVQSQNRIINEMKPKAEYFDALVDKNLLTNLRDTAKELHIAPSKFNEFLLENEYIYKDSKDVIKPYQPRVKQGLFELKEYINPYSGHIGNQTMVTPKGRETFRLLFQNI